MAGFKSTIQDYSPVLFLTFDGDNFNPVSGELIASPEEIIDESPFGNFGVLHSDDTGTHYGYRLGIPSLVELEPSDQYCMAFGYHGYQAAAPQGPWAKAFIEVVHESQYDFYDGATKLGDFTVGFMFNKAANEQTFRTTPSGTNTSTLVRTFARKASVFDIYLTDYWGLGDKLSFVTPGGLLEVNISTIDSEANFYGRDHMLVMTWRVQNIAPGEFVGTATIYYDAKVIATQSWFYETAPPNTSVVTSFEIGGTIAADAAPTYNDRQTTDTRMDQFFVLDQALTTNDVLRLWKKTKTYETLVRYSNPTHYWLLDDAESTSFTEMNALIGTDGTYVGGVSKVIREQLGPPEIPGSKSVYFFNGGSAIAGNASTSILFNPSADYTIGFWVKTENTARSVIFAILSDVVPYQGMSLQLNWANNSYSSGAIQFSISDDYQISSGANAMTDGGWHYVAMIRRGATIELWLDGSMVGDLDVPVFQTSFPGRVYLMSMMPGKLNTNGFLSNVELHTRALEPQEITVRWTYRTIYKINGTVTLLGQPYPAKIRAMNHLTGDFIRETTADENDGSYEIPLYDNTALTVLALNPVDQNVRPRVYGPIVPTYYPDTV